MQSGSKETAMENRPRCLVNPRTAALAALMTAVACGKARQEPAADDGLAEVVLALTQPPSDVKCLVVTVTTDHPDARHFDVGGGDMTVFSLRRLPVGLVVLSVDAFQESCALAGGKVPTWTGGPLTVTLNSGLNADIPVQMRPNSQATVRVDFPDGGATCAPANAGCLVDADCCMGNHCVIDNPEPAGGSIGQCRPLPPASDTPSITLDLTGEHHYLLFAPDHGPGCADSGSTSWIQVNEDDTETCVLSEVPVVAVPVTNIEVCTASSTGGTCTPCQDASCGLASCFANAQPGTSGCATTLQTLLSTRFIVLRKPDLANPPARPDQLPQLVTASASSNVKLVPTAGQSTIVKVTLNTDGIAPAQAGDRCGGGGLCGMVPYRVVSGSVAGFSLTPDTSTTLSTSPVF
jgi:hypothetical protein